MLFCLKSIGSDTGQFFLFIEFLISIGIFFSSHVLSLVEHDFYQNYVRSV